MNRPPNWLEMPHDLMASILHRLGIAEILNSLWKVCTTWQKICKDPAMWRIIDIPPPDKPYNINYDMEMLIKHAVDLSCGELINLSLDSFIIDDLLDYIVLRSSKLKRLCIKNSEEVTGRGFSYAIKNLPHLETLHLADTCLTTKDIEVIGQNCPQLKSFTMNESFQGRYNDDKALAIANNMVELRSLQLIGNDMTRKGLEAILNGCPHLETLDVRRCFYLRLGGKFGKACMERVKDLKRPHDSMENCGFHYESDRDDHMYDTEYSDVDDSSEDDL